MSWLLSLRSVAAACTREITDVSAAEKLRDRGAGQEVCKGTRPSTFSWIPGISWQNLLHPLSRQCWKECWREAPSELSCSWPPLRLAFFLGQKRDKISLTISLPAFWSRISFFSATVTKEMHPGDAFLTLWTLQSELFRSVLRYNDRLYPPCSIPSIGVLGYFQILGFWGGLGNNRTDRSWTGKKAEKNRWYVVSSLSNTKYKILPTCHVA